MKRRMIRGKVYTYCPTVTVEWVRGFTMSFQREAVVDELVIDALIAMHFGGVQVAACAGRVTSRFA